MQQAGYDNNTQAKPLSLMEKAFVGVKSFVKSSLEYVPSGLLFTGLFMAGSMALSFATGGATDIAGIMLASGGLDVGAMAMKVIGTLALGSAIAGSIGAYKGISAAGEQRQSEAEWQQRGRSVSPRQLGLQRSQSAGMTEQTMPQRNLPGQQRQTGQHVAPGY